VVRDQNRLDEVSGENRGCFEKLKLPNGRLLEKRETGQSLPLQVGASSMTKGNGEKRGCELQWRSERGLCRGSIKAKRSGVLKWGGRINLEKGKGGISWREGKPFCKKSPTSRERRGPSLTKKKKKK